MRLFCEESLPRVFFLTEGTFCIATDCIILISWNPATFRDTTAELQPVGTKNFSDV